MALATATPDGQPSVRMVLMKGLDVHGFAFFTNAESQKGEELAANPNASCPLPLEDPPPSSPHHRPGHKPFIPEESDHYFHSRSRGSQIGAAVSQQSRPLDTREHLEAAARQFAAAAPRRNSTARLLARLRHSAPASLSSGRMGPDRLHDRMLYTRDSSGVDAHPPLSLTASPTIL